MEDRPRGVCGADADTIVCHFCAQWPRVLAVISCTENSIKNLKKAAVVRKIGKYGGGSAAGGIHELPYSGDPHETAFQIARAIRDDLMLDSDELDEHCEKAGADETV